MMLRFLVTAATLALAVPATAQPVIDAPAGSVRGNADGDIRVFRGIPYAQPPVKGLRWRAPQPLARWQGVRPATDFGPACIQPTVKTPNLYSPDVPLPTSEDCLSLNIWSPRDTKDAPVLVWIHGGALSSGSSSEPMYDGKKLAERGIIVVSINYRLGVLGWLAHPALSMESPKKVSGNYGLLDQIAALHWVRGNIGAFGGDASRVTIAGESAGGLSVMYLLETPLARGLFSGAIAQSAYMVSMPELKKSVFGAPSGEAVGQMLSGGLQAPDIATLRGMKPQELTDRSAGMGFAPFGVVDGFVLPEQMVDTFDAGRQAPVPLMAGFNQGEIRSLRMLAPKAPADAATYEKEIRARYGDLADEFLRLYPAADFAESIIATTRDALYGWTAERLVRKQTALGKPAYLYLFDHGYPASDSAGLHAFHAAELPYMFGNLAVTPPRWPKIPDAPVEHVLSDAMVGYWASFARDGRPTAPNAPDWPTYGKDGGFIHFTDVPRAGTGMMPGMFALNEQVMCRRRAGGKVGWNWNVGLVAPKPLPSKVEGC